eukprot:765852-Hanusia_phi.AAC.5
MTNLTEENQTRFKQPPNSSNLCVYARPMYLVDINSSFQLGMELVMDYTFETLRLDVLYLICRVLFFGASEFNPLGLQLADPQRLLAVQQALATLAQVQLSNVVFQSSANYTNGSSCSVSLSCPLEFFVLAQHDWQYLNLRRWISQFQSAVESSQLQLQTLRYHVNVSAAFAEPITWSPRLVPRPSCPPPPQVSPPRPSPRLLDLCPRQYRASAPLAWALGAGTPVGEAASGFATASSASCLFK